MTDFGLARLAEGRRADAVRMAGYAGVHVAGAGAGAAGGPAVRHMVAGRGAVRDGDGAYAVRRRPRRSGALRDCACTPHEPITALRVGVPAELDRIVGKALAKNPADRYQHVDDLIVDLSTLKKRMASGESAPVSGTGATNARGWTRYAMYGALAVVTAYAAWVSVPVHFGEPRSGSPLPLRRFSFTPDSLSSPGQSSGRDLAGRQAHRLYQRGFGRRDLDSRHGQRAAAATGGNRNARAPFWSPDSALVGFFPGLQLKKVAAGGGAVTTVCTMPPTLRTELAGYLESGWQLDRIWEPPTLFCIRTRGSA